MNRVLICALLVCIALVVSQDEFVSPPRYLRRLQTVSELGLVTKGFSGGAQPEPRRCATTIYDDQVNAEYAFIYGGRKQGRASKSDLWQLNMTLEQWQLFDGNGYVTNQYARYDEMQVLEFGEKIRPGASQLAMGFVVERDEAAVFPFSTYDMYCIFGGLGKAAYPFVYGPLNGGWCFNPRAEVTSTAKWIRFTGDNVTYPEEVLTPAEGEKVTLSGRHNGAVWHDKDTSALYMFSGVHQQTSYNVPNDMWRFNLTVDPKAQDSPYGWELIHPANIGVQDQTVFQFSSIWPMGRYRFGYHFNRATRHFFMIGSDQPSGEAWIYSMELNQWRPVGGRYSSSITPVSMEAYPLNAWISHDFTVALDWPWGGRAAAPVVFDSVLNAYIFVCGTYSDVGLEDIWALDAAQMLTDANAVVRVARLSGDTNYTATSDGPYKFAEVFETAFDSRNHLGDRWDLNVFFRPSGQSLFIYGGVMFEESEIYLQQSPRSFNDLWVLEAERPVCTDLTIPAGGTTEEAQCNPGRLTCAVPCKTRYVGGSADLLAGFTGEVTAVCVNGRWKVDPCSAQPQSSSGEANAGVASEPWFIVLMIVLGLGVVAVLVVAYFYFGAKKNAGSAGSETVSASEMSSVGSQ